MAENSYPVIEKPMGVSEWSSVTLGIGSGVFDYGGGAYSYSIDDATDTVKIMPDSKKGYADAIVQGFYHRITAPVTLSLPPVRELTTYTIALCYDPLNAAEPVKLKVVTGELDRLNGKKWLILHRFTRAASNALSRSFITTHKPAIAPHINVGSYNLLPEAEDTLLGSTAYVNDEAAFYRLSTVNGSLKWWRFTGVVPAPMGKVGGWEVRSPSGANLQVEASKDSWACKFSGNLTRKSYAFPVSSSEYKTLGAFIPSDMRLPSGYTAQIPAVYWDSKRGTVDTHVRVNFKTGVLDVKASSGSFDFLEEGELHLNLSWTVPRDTSRW